MASSDNHFAFLHFFSLGMVLITASCTMSQTSIHSSSGTLSDLISWIYLSFPLYNCKGFDLCHPSPSEGSQNENHNHRKLTKAITWTTALSNSRKLCHVGPPKFYPTYPHYAYSSLHSSDFCLTPPSAVDNLLCKSFPLLISFILAAFISHHSGSFLFGNTCALIPFALNLNQTKSKQKSLLDFPFSNF